MECRKTSCTGPRQNDISDALHQRAFYIFFLYDQHIFPNINSLPHFQNERQSADFIGSVYGLHSHATHLWTLPKVRMTPEGTCSQCTSEEVVMCRRFIWCCSVRMDYPLTWECVAGCNCSTAMPTPRVLICRRRWRPLATSMLVFFSLYSAVLQHRERWGATIVEEVACLCRLPLYKDTFINIYASIHVSV